MAQKVPAEENNDRATPDVVATKEAGPTFAAAEEAISDLSSEIIKSLPRASDERITCRRISGNHYRCNWWSPQLTNGFDNPSMTGLTVTTHRVSKSQMLH